MSASVRMILAVGMAGFCGAIARFLVSGWVHRVVPAAFPLGTLFVNTAGSFMLGALFELATARAALDPQLRLVLGVGFLGSFTTFSSFSLETMNLIREGSHALAGANVVMNVVFCLAAVWVGIVLVRLFA